MKISELNLSELNSKLQEANLEKSKHGGRYVVFNGITIKDKLSINKVLDQMKVICAKHAPLTREDLNHIEQICQRLKTLHGTLDDRSFKTRLKRIFHIFHNPKSGIVSKDDAKNVSAVKNLQETLTKLAAKNPIKKTETPPSSSSITPPAPAKTDQNTQDHVDLTIDPEPMIPIKEQITEPALPQLPEIERTEPEKKMKQFASLIPFFEKSEELFASIDACTKSNLAPLEAFIDKEARKSDCMTVTRLPITNPITQNRGNSSFAIVFPSPASDLKIDHPVALSRNWITNQWTYLDDNGEIIEFDWKNIRVEDRVILLQKRYLATPQTYQSEHEHQNGTYRAVRETPDSNTPPFYHEERMGRGYCAKHALNAIMGDHFLGAKQIWADENQGMFTDEVMEKLKIHNIHSRLITILEGEWKPGKLKGKDRFILDGFDRSGNPHAIAFRLDKTTGEWWRINSLAVEKGKLIQEVVDLEQELVVRQAVVDREQEVAGREVIVLETREEMVARCTKSLNKLIDMYQKGLHLKEQDKYTKIFTKIFRDLNNLDSLSTLDSQLALRQFHPLTMTKNHLDQMLKAKELIMTTLLPASAETN